MITLLVAGSGFLIIGSGKRKIPVPAYHAERVIDGDTFVTTEHQSIRLADIDAPDLRFCGGTEAKKELERLVLEKPLYLKVLFRDRFNRLISSVYTPDGEVSLSLAKGGFVVYDQTIEDNHPIEDAANRARNQAIGIFGSPCTQKSNTTRPDCLIKGNSLAGKNYYRFPGCGQYTQTIVQLYRGEQWFCTEKEAKAAGFTKGSDCFEKSWKP